MEKPLKTTRSRGAERGYTSATAGAAAGDGAGDGARLAHGAKRAAERTVRRYVGREDGAAILAAQAEAMAVSKQRRQRWQPLHLVVAVWLLAMGSLVVRH